MKILVTFILLTITSHAAFGVDFLLEIKGRNVLTNNDFSATFTDAKKATVIVFLSAKCPCSASHEPLLKEIAQKYKDYKFIGIHSNFDEDDEITLAHFKQSNLPFEVIQDQKSALANRFGALKTPHAFVFDHNGALLYQGGLTDSHIASRAKKIYLKEVLDDIGAGVKLRYNEGRTLGCYIQRGED